MSYLLIVPYAIRSNAKIVKILVFYFFIEKIISKPPSFLFFAETFPP